MSEEEQPKTVKGGFVHSAQSLGRLESIGDLSGVQHLEDIITKGGRRIFCPPECDFDMYQCSEYKVDYKYYQTMFPTQIGEIGLVATEAEVVLPDGTTLSAARPPFRYDVLRKKQLEACCGLGCGGA